MNDMFLDDIKKDVSVTTYTDTSTSNSKWLVMNCTVHIQIYLSSIKFPGGKVIGRDADLPSVSTIEIAFALVGGCYFFLLLWLSM